MDEARPDEAGYSSQRQHDIRGAGDRLFRRKFPVIGRCELSAAIVIAAARPGSVQGQQTGRTPKVGILWHAGSAEEEGRHYVGVVQGFRNLVYEHGLNIILEHRFPNEIPKRFRSMLA